jgi:hypothetical protein
MMTVASQSEPTEIGDQITSAASNVALKYILSDAGVCSSRLYWKEARLALPNFDAYGKGIDVKTKQKVNMHPKELKCFASKMGKYFYDESFYNKKPLIRQGTSQIHFSRRKAVVICAPRDKPTQCVVNHSSIQTPTFIPSRLRYSTLSV